MVHFSFNPLIATICLGLCSNLALSKPIGHSHSRNTRGGNVAHLWTETVDEAVFDHKHFDTRDVELTITRRDGTWTVRNGDSGNQIASTLNITFEQLAALNPTVSWTSLQIGQVLQIPCEESDDSDDSISSSTSTYTVQGGDTGNIIATKYGITFAQLAAANSGINWYNLQIGQVISIPTTTSATTSLSFTSSATTGSSTTLSSTTIVTAANIELVTTTTSVTQSTTTTDNPTTTTGSSPQDNPFLNPPAVKRRALLDGKSAHLVRHRLRQVARQLSAAYTVVAGDTGLAIAAAEGITFAALSSANPGVVWTNLQIGQTLNLPVSMNSTASMNSTTPVLNGTTSANLPRNSDVYTYYSGSTAATWPLMSSWESFQTMWAANLPNIGTVCSFAAGTFAPNTQAETQALQTSITTVANSTGIDAAFILALVLQESSGCVRVPTTSSWQGIENTGLMQSFKGSATCNNDGSILSPCPTTTILQMIQQGIVGNQNVGILPAMRTVVAANGGSRIQRRSLGKRSQYDAWNYYLAARIYNSGSLPSNGDLSGESQSTACYVSDVANRLTGWVNAPRQCNA